MFDNIKKTYQMVFHFKFNRCNLYHNYWFDKISKTNNHVNKF